MEHERRGGKGHGHGPDGRGRRSRRGGPFGQGATGKQKPLINWDVIDEMLMRRMPPPPQGPEGQGSKMPGRGIGGWDAQAENYNRMVQMEKRFTPNQLDCFKTDPSDTVLDVGCGPGRVAIPMAQRAASVTALDASPKMLEILGRNAADAGVTNIKTLLVDWEDDESVDAIERHDIVIASRSPALGDLKLLSKLARKQVVLIIWANNAPCIPMITGALFKGTHPEGADGRPPFMPQFDRRFGNNLLYNKIYDMGFEPNLKYVDDGYTRVFKDREEAYSELLKFARDEVPSEKIDVFRSNADEYLTDNEDGTVTYFAKTRTVVYWWDTSEWHRRREERRKERAERRDAERQESVD
ncbi:MAG: class I SAM-dependent methyltransferase [Clostridiales Family XIII bacterium]|nr:class I SAM-dependent methyltransferase [Clostridiales Family XIII bacterium]